MRGPLSTTILAIDLLYLRERHSPLPLVWLHPGQHVRPPPRDRQTFGPLKMVKRRMAVGQFKLTYTSNVIFSFSPFPLHALPSFFIFPSKPFLLFISPLSPSQFFPLFPFPTFSSPFPFLFFPSHFSVPWTYMCQGAGLCCPLLLIRKIQCGSESKLHVQIA